MHMMLPTLLRACQVGSSCTALSWTQMLVGLAAQQKGRSGCPARHNDVAYDFMWMSAGVCGCAVPLQ